jgi:hypothetical protein
MESAVRAPKDADGWIQSGVVALQIHPLFHVKADCRQRGHCADVATNIMARSGHGPVTEKAGTSGVVVESGGGGGTAGLGAGTVPANGRRMNSPNAEIK